MKMKLFVSFALMQILSSDILVFFVLRSCVLRKLGYGAGYVVGSWSWGANLLIFASLWCTHFGTNDSSLVRGWLPTCNVLVMAWSRGYHFCCFFVSTLQWHTRARFVLLLWVLNVVSSYARYMSNSLDFQTLAGVLTDLCRHCRLRSSNCCW
jgi:hypothetical protein